MAWEVRQWRASRAREPERAAPMMLVRTEQGFQPAPIDLRAQYVWDQPLHPEREQQQARANGHGTNGNGANGHATNEVAKPIPYSGVTTAHPAPTSQEPESDPAPAHAADAMPAAPVTQEEPAAPTEAVPEPVHRPAPRVQPTPLEPRSEDTVSISKKAVAVAIVLALGLPLGGKALNLAGSEPEASRGPAAAKAGVPAAIAAGRSGFLQVSGDAVRYAVLIRNPNPSHAARNVTVSVSLFDAKGRLVGTDAERLAVVDAGSTAAIAGTTGVDGRVSRLAVRLGSDGFVEGGGTRFTVRSVALSRSGPDLVVRAALSAARATKNARVVVVHLDGRGAIVGGDVAYVDIPRTPRSVSAAIATSGAGARVRRVQVYVLAPR